MRHPPGLILDDAHNRALIENVHPPGWRNPEPARRYHLVVVGAGTAGLVTAAGAAGLGARVALVERHFMGGDCLVTGCVPSKAVIRSSRVVAELREAAALGVKVPEGVTIDFGAVIAAGRAWTGAGPRRRSRSTRPATTRTPASVRCRWCRVR